MSRKDGERYRTWCAAGPVVAIILACGMAGQACRAADEPVPDSDELQARWEYCGQIQLSADKQGALVDVLLDPRVFTHARLDLGDLRLYDAADQSVPYALRVLQRTYRRDPYPAKEFNRAAGPDGSSELTLDLQRDPPEQEPVEHNEVEITTPGTEFRRHVVVDGSDDGVNWSKLAETELIRFDRGGQRIDGNTVSYSPSRYRQLRVRVFPDKSIDQDPVHVEKVIVVRKIDVPGEMVTREGQLGPREPVMADGGPGSAWIIELGGDRVPCERIEVDVDDSEFAQFLRRSRRASGFPRNVSARVHGRRPMATSRRASEATVDRSIPGSARQPAETGGDRLSQSTLGHSVGQVSAPRLARLYLCHPPRAMRSCGCSSATRMQWPPTMTLPAIFRRNCRHRRSAPRWARWSPTPTSCRLPNR